MIRILILSLIILNNCGKKGDLILSTQTLFHRGNPEHSERTRYVLIFYFSLKKYGPYPEFTLGKAS